MEALEAEAASEGGAMADDISCPGGCWQSSENNNVASVVT